MTAREKLGAALKWHWLRAQRLARSQCSWWRLAITVTVSPLLFYLVARALSARYLWCAMDPVVQYDTCEAGKRVSDLFAQNDIKHWMQLGDSIGLLRHGGQVPWEHDIDICVPEEQFEKASSLLKSPAKGFSWYQKRADGGLWIYVYPSMGPYLFGRWFQPVIVDVWNCTDVFPGSLDTIEVGWYNYCNSHLFPFPKDLYRYVNNVYGDDWKTPRYEHNILRCRMWNDSPQERMKMSPVNGSEDFYAAQAKRIQQGYLDGIRTTVGQAADEEILREQAAGGATEKKSFFGTTDSGR